MNKIRIFKAGLHGGEEKIVVGNHLAGMISFSGCHLACNFCYTPETSVFKMGEDHSQGSFYDELERLVVLGAQNINLITPSHLWTHLEEPLTRFKEKYDLPLVLKVTGYEPRLLERFSKIADVLVPDFKVFSRVAAEKVNLPLNYGAVAKAEIEDLLRLYPTPAYNSDGQLTRGILIRHLMMPGFFSDSLTIVSQLREIGYRSYFNIMTAFIDPHTHKITHPKAEELKLICDAVLKAEMILLVNGRRWEDVSKIAWAV